MSRPVKRALGHRFSRPLVQYSQVPSVHPSHGTPTRSPSCSRWPAPAPRASTVPDDLVPEDPRRLGDLDLAVERGAGRCGTPRTRGHGSAAGPVPARGPAPRPRAAAHAVPRSIIARIVRAAAICSHIDADARPTVGTHRERGAVLQPSGEHRARPAPVHAQAPRHAGADPGPGSARSPSATGWGGSVARLPPRATAELELVHAPEYVREVRDAVRLAVAGLIDPDTAVVPESWPAALHAAGGDLRDGAGAGRRRRAGRLLRDPALGPSRRTRPRDGLLRVRQRRGGGRAGDLRELGLQRVFVLDWDVHHGNGTAELFRTRSDVLFASHAPVAAVPGHGSARGRGQRARARATRSTCPCRPGPGRSCGWSCSTVSSCPRRGRSSRELILVSSGFDAHAGDPLAHCLLETETFVAMAARMRALAAELGVGLGLVQEGGYEPRDPGRVRVRGAAGARGGGGGRGRLLAPAIRWSRGASRSTRAGGRVGPALRSPAPGRNSFVNGGKPGRVRVVLEQPVREHPAAERRPLLRALPAVGLARFARQRSRAASA